MNNLKRTLALMLVLCMVCSLMPVNVIAADGSIGHMATKPADGTTTGEPFPENTGSSYSFRIPAMVTLSDGTIVAAADARWNTTYDGGGLDTIVARSTNGGANWSYTFANYLGDNGNVYNYNSTCFIDPSLAVLTTDENNDGVGEDTIYMLCDLYPYGVALNGNGSQTAPKYDTGFNDAGKLLLSNDSYASYDYYLDGENICSSDGTAVSGYTVDEHFNVFKNGTYHSNLFFSDCDYKVARTGFLYLTTSTDGGASWSAPTLLPLKNAQEAVCLVGPGRGLVTYDGTIIFPIYGYAGENSKYTGLIYSEDNGATWNRTTSFSQIISSEATMVELDNGSIRTFFRNDNATLCYADYKPGTNGMSDGWWGTYVNTGVKCNSDTELSAIAYTNTVNDQQVILVSAPAGPNAAGSDNNNGAYRSSGKIFAGLINDDDNFTMTWLDNSVAVTNVATSAFSGSTYTAAQGFFAYSCLTELNDGSVAILYEDNQYGWGAGNGLGYTMAYKTYSESDLETALGVTFDDDTNTDIDAETPAGQYEKDITIKVGETFTETVENIFVTDGSKENDIVSVTWDGNEASTSTTYATATLGSTTAFDGTTIDVANCLYTFTETSSGVWEITGTTSDGATVYFYPGNSKDGTTDKSAGYPNCLEANLPDGLEVYVLEGAESGSVYLKSNTNVWGNPAWVQFDRDAYRWNRVENVNSTTYQTDGSLYLYRKAGANETSSSEIPGYVKVASYADVVNGQQYLIAAPGADGATYIAYPSTDTTTLYNQIAKVTGNTVTSGTEATPSTIVSITGKAVGKTTVEIGTGIIYNVTVNSADVDNVVNITMNVGETYTYIDNTGAYTTATTEPDSKIVDMDLATVAGTEKTLDEITDADYSFDATKQYLIVNSRAATADPTHSVLTDESYSSNGASWLGTLTGLNMNADNTADSAEIWTITPSGNGYTISRDGSYLNMGDKSASMSETAEVMTMTYSSDGWKISDGTYYLSDLAGTSLTGAHGWNDAGDGGNYWTIYEVQGGAASTEITFTGVSVGTTYAIVGNTQYNITVNSDQKIINVNLEVGETKNFTDTTGNYVGLSTNVDPNKSVAVMSVADGLALQAVTTLEDGKQYLIVNKATGQILTDTEMKVTGDYGNKDGLATTGTASANSKELWTFTEVNGNFYVTQNSKYLAVAGFEAHMYETAVPLTVSYTDNGWVIYDDTTGPALGHAASGYYLSDNAGNNYVNGALGTSDTSNAYRYWDIYEILPLNTEISFTGIEVGNTEATVGTTQYIITVEEYKLDDEINDSTDGYTVNAELQRSRYNELIAGVAKDLYTDESWPAYEAARKAAYAKLGEVDGTTYATEAEAEAAINELIAAIDALEEAKGELVAAKTITINYQLNGTTVLTENYKIAKTATELTLPENIVAAKQIYSISDTQTGDDVVIADGVMTLNPDETHYNVAVNKVGTQGNGFVASGDISADGDYVGTGAQIADLVKDDGTAMKITEMTLTTGFSYDLEMADTLADGQTVEWTSDNEAVATVDQNGNVTAVAEGTANVIATVKDANGNVVSVNTIPVTVFPSASTDRVSAVYIENIENTTVYCVVNANTDARAFEVVEGELIYGKFDTTVDDGTATTAFSFFGDPDEAHALVAMTSTNSFGDYYLLHDDDGNLGIGTEYYRLPDNTTGAGYWQAIGLTDNNHDGKADWTKIEAMINWAINKGCDGGMGFTRRQGEGNIGTNLTFISDPMPKIDKTVDGVLPTSRKTADYRRYTKGMVAAVNELVYFKITVTLDRPTTFTDEAKTISAITYDDAFVSDTILKGAYLYTKELDQADGVYDGEIDEAHRTQIKEITDQLNAPWAAGETQRVLEFYLLYEIQESDIPKFNIDNIAYLNYDYESHYSTGAQAGAADAEASISVVGSAIDNVVIDFGQSFTYESHEYTSITDGNSYVFEGLTNVHLKGVYVDGENDEGINRTTSLATAKYGEVKVYREATGTLDDKGYPEYSYTVVYTPTSILLEPDAVLMYGVGEGGKEKIINGFLVYPATTVYYEEGFLLENNKSWPEDGAAKATTKQAFELLGDSQFNEHGELTHKVSNKKYAYGYDPIYNGDGDNDVVKSSMSATTVGANTTFTFTGTGFELFADCTTSSGYVQVTVQNAAGENVKIFMVNTVVAAGSSDATTGQSGNMNSLPIVSIKDLTHGTYTVTLRKVMNDGKAVAIDGVRIINTVPDTSVFNIDLEDNPEFYQLRDVVLHAIGVGAETSEDYGDLTGKAQQVYNDLFYTDDETEEPEIPAVITDPLKIYGDDADIQDLLDNGPKNEVYLWTNQTLTFKVSTARAMQLGLKAPSGSTNYTIKINGNTLGTESTDLATTVDLFYELGNEIGTETEYTISIKNTGSNVLSITDLKICDDPSAYFVSLTEDDIRDILVDAGYTDGETDEPDVPVEPEEPEIPEEPVITYADAVVNISVINYLGHEIASAALTANGISGEQCTFSAEDLAAAVQLPNGYAFVSDTLSDAHVAYGETGTVVLMAGKVATLKIVYVNIFGRIVDTATLTEVQTANGDATFSAFEIRGNAPAGRLPVWLGNAMVAYGSTSTLIVPVI